MRQSRLPVLVRALVWTVSWIVPSRTEWRAQWGSLLQSVWILYERGELRRRDLMTATRRCATDAWSHSRYSPRSPRFVLAAGLVALAALGILSRGFSATRQLFRPLPVEHRDRLVWIQYTGSVGQPMGVPPHLLPVWRAHSTLLSGLAAYWHRPYTSYAHVTGDFFPVLGTKPVQGRLFRPGERNAALLSYTGWRQLYGADPQVIGHRITIEDKIYTVIGVLPKTFWAVSPRILVWLPLDLESPGDSSVPWLIPAVGRLKPGATSESLRTDLFNTAKAEHQPLPRRPEVVAFGAVSGPPLPGYLWGIAFAIGVAGVIIVKQQGIQFRRGWRYRRFLLAKILLLTMIPALAWVESTLTGLASLPFLAACSWTFWWSFADQRRRCPECLQRLALPVTMGSWASVLEPVSTEFLCESGHGSLSVPETEQGQPDRWTALDASWKDLFEKTDARG